MNAPMLADPRDAGVAALEGMQVAAFALNNGFGIQSNKYTKDNGALVMERVAVFRSGTFSDSLGRENTWEQMHMNQMIENWKHLRDSGTFADIPVRDGHPGWIVNGQKGNGKVVGWHTNLSVEEIESKVDGQKYHYLLADYEILDEDAKRDINSGLWRNRSSEIGTYITNNKAEHWPVYMGVAYVDIPAVEGLNFSTSNSTGPAPKVYVIFDNKKEKNVGDTPPAAPSQGTQTASEGTAQHSSASSGQGGQSAPAFQFSIGGQQTTDAAAVQNHINALELFQRETVQANRENFVTALAAQNKIPAPQLDNFKKHAVGLSAEQYEAFTKLYGDMEVPALLGQHAAPASNEGSQSGAQHGTAQANGSRQAILREQVAMHVSAGTPKSAIQNMGSYKELVTLDPSFKL